MHRALFSFDILLEIFAHFCKDIANLHFLDLSSGESERDRTSLIALARTCKTFYEPAMDFLWADIGYRGIYPLLGCVTRLRPLMYRDHGEVGTDY